MLGDIEVHDAPALMPPDDKTVEHTESRRQHGKEVDAGQLTQVIVQKRAPGLRRRSPTADHVLGDRAFGQQMTQQPEFRLDSGRAPSGILRAHLSDKLANFKGDCWSTKLPAPGLPSPIQTKSLTVPMDNRFRLDDHQRGAPTRPQAPQPSPDYAVTRTQLRTFAGSVRRR